MTIETVLKVTSASTGAGGAGTSVISGLWLAQHQEILAALGVLFGMAVATIGLIATIWINIYYKRKHFRLAEQQRRRVDDYDNVGLRDDMPEPPNR